MAKQQSRNASQTMHSKQQNVQYQGNLRSMSKQQDPQTPRILFV